MRVIASVQSKRSSSRGLIHYIAHSKIDTEREPEKGRELFNAFADDLSVQSANNSIKADIVRGRPSNDELHHLVLSFRADDYCVLGRTEKQRRAALKETTRASMKELEAALNADRVAWAAAVHLNTENPHVHIAIQKEFLARDLEMRLMTKIPRESLPHFKRRDDEKVFTPGVLIEAATEKMEQLIAGKRERTRLREENRTRNESISLLHGKTEVETGSEVGKATTDERDILGRATTQYLITELKEVARELGRTPTTHDWPALREQERVYPLYIYYAVFGSFLSALRRAKLKPRYKQEFDASDRERLLNELRQLRRELGRPLFDEDVDDARRRREVSPPYHFARAFGSVPAAIEEAGAAKKIYSREELITILRELDATLDRPIQGSDIQSLYEAGEGPSLKVFLKEFATLSKARRAARTQTAYRKAQTRTTYWQKYTKSELLAQLKALGRKLRRKPTDRDINAASKLGESGSSTTFARMFGNLPVAYRAAGFGKVKPSSYTDEEIVLALKKLSKKFGRMPTFHEIRRASIRGECPSPRTIVRRIGGLTDLKSQFER